MDSVFPTHSHHMYSFLFLHLPVSSLFFVAAMYFFGISTLAHTRMRLTDRTELIYLRTSALTLGWCGARIHSGWRIAGSFEGSSLDTFSARRGSAEIQAPNSSMVERNYRLLYMTVDCCELTTSEEPGAELERLNPRPALTQDAGGVHG